MKTILGLRENQQNFQEQLCDSEHIQSKLKACLTTSKERGGSKVSQALLVRAKHLSNTLEDEKDEFKQQKKKLKADIAQVNSVMKVTLRQEREERRAERKELLKRGSKGFQLEEINV